LGTGLRPAGAGVTTEESASILIFPKVIANGSRDTIIQITNTSNNMRHAHCFYVNGAPTIADEPISDTNPPLWTEIDFDIWLTKQQPTHWTVSTGRLVFPLDRTCAQTDCVPDTTGTDDADCCDAGIDPGRVPPVPPDFTGELKCIEVDASGFPVPGNALKGEATLVDLPSEALRDGDVSKYNAIGLKGFDTNNMDGTLCLGGDVSQTCPAGAEYAACPRLWFLDHPADGAEDPVVDEVDGLESSASTTLTLVPCTQNFETQEPEPVTLQFIITNEFEQSLSASTTFQCWASYTLNGNEADAANPFGGISSAFESGTIGGDVLKTQMRVVGGVNGVVPVIETTTAVDGTFARHAENPHSSFEDVFGPDLITIPSEQIQVPEE
jgi:hypothetical protein